MGVVYFGSTVSLVTVKLKSRKEVDIKDEI